MRDKETDFTRNDSSVTHQFKVNANDNFVVANDNFVPVAVVAEAA